MERVMCPDPLTLAELASGPPSSRRESLLRHAEGCGACRGALSDLAAIRGLEQPLEPPVLDRAVQPLRSPPRRWVPWAAAAALLLGVFLVRERVGQPPAPASSSPVAVRPLPKAWEAGPSFLGRASSLALREGSRARIAPGELLLLEGAAWVEDPGEPLILRAGEVPVQVEAGVFLLELRPKAFAWLQEAAASEGEAFLFVVSGSARVEGRMVEAGMRIPLEPLGGPVRFTDLPWRGDAGWQRLPGLPLLVTGGEQVLGPEPPPEAYAWELVFRRGEPTAAAGIRFAAGEKGWRLPLGEVLGGSGDWVRVRVEVQGGWARLLAGSRELLRQPVAALGAGLEPVPPGLGLRSWGGVLEVKEARWKPLP